MTDDDHKGETPDAERPLASQTTGVPEIRPAGPEAIPDLPPRLKRSWDDVDQAGDESFPASDPPGQGVG
ncbi:hypothetical protein [Polymorphobacter fuscus]|uniref:Uncharacterized protein n=1 Tax=Sandarakinorhabdus fusca TaxID=1439888 RepID=A0A7C9GRC3_9SPHN|nr:hypothetical protein [Polymorphobacter fuscus]KAB7647754.1 hypothetical protein F9290_07235 [Polymorphobacter fuscus]MQT17051.1 hypothetical protein [Polymorphobacter fuscus]NJC08957.1 hypothetical protein [Polymorphobacter fuscus]